jgi:hypothetical protein
VKQFWTIVAGVCIVAAGVALWRWHTDAAFIIATLGVLAWFLNYRVQMKEAAARNSQLHNDPDREQSNENQ